MRQGGDGASRAGARRQALAKALSALAPRLPRFETEAVLDRAEASAGLRRAAPEAAVWLALVALARHAFTEYDGLLADGYDRDSARHFVLDDLNAALAEWGVRRLVSGEEDCSGEEDDAAEDRAWRA